MITLYNMDVCEALKQIPNESVDCIVTSPPYFGVRNYKGETETVWGENKMCEHEFEVKERYVHRGSSKTTVHHAIKKGNLQVDWKTQDKTCKKCGAWKGSLGLEEHPQDYINHIVEVSTECMRVLKKTGVFFLNLGDTYYTKSGSGFKGDKFKSKFLDEELSNHSNKIRGKFKSNWLQSKQKLLIPHKIAIALQEKGFLIRDDCVWVKKLMMYPEKETIGSTMPFPVQDKLLPSTEYIFQIVKNRKYYFNLEDLRTPIKNSSFNRMKHKESSTMNKEGSPYKEQKLKEYWDKQTSKKLTKNQDAIVGKGYQNWSVTAEVQDANPTNAIMFRRSDEFSKQDKDNQHFASFPETLAEFFILVGCPKDGVVLDPFA